MRLKDLIALPHYSGNRIDLKWVNPLPDEYPGIRVMRREGTYPVSPTDGILVDEGSAFLFSLELAFINELDMQTLSPDLQQKFLDNEIILSNSAKLLVEVAGNKWKIIDREQIYLVRKNFGTLGIFGKGLISTVDRNLKGETVYYYTLFPFKGDPREYIIDFHNRTSAMATASYNFAGQMMDLLPAIYHRYDVVLPRPLFPDEMPEEDKKRGQLRRFLDIPGSQLDQLFSCAKAMFNLYDIDHVDGDLLTLLGQWIGWDTDFTLEISGRRNELRNAPAWYKTAGLIPNAEATIKRVSGWESRTKEFVHNVFISNRPERLNLWERQRNESGLWSEPTMPLSLNFAYEGRPAIVNNEDGTVSLFYHTLKNGYWNIWYKNMHLFKIDLEYENDLDSGAVSVGLQQVFFKNGFSLTQNARVKKNGNEWVVNDNENIETYTVRQGSSELDVYRWAPSQPLTNRPQVDKHPATALQGDKLWVFWDVYNEKEGKSHIHYRTRTDNMWSVIKPDELFANTGNERKSPAVLVDNANVLWLFWLEKEGAAWGLNYNRYDGTTWGSAVSFPMDNGNDPDVRSAPFVFFHPDDTKPPVWIFWAYRVQTAIPDQVHWQIAYRIKQSIDFSNSADWSEIKILPKVNQNSDDLEPAVLLNTLGEVELFWSSNQAGSWSIWNSKLIDLITNDWENAVPVTGNPYSQRDPLPFFIEKKVSLIYRANESVIYSNEVYKATETVDFRFSGSTTADTLNTAKIALRRAFGDFQTYTYDTEKSNDDWYARDTVGAYLIPGADDDESVVRKRNIIAGVLRKFLPVQVRSVFILQQVDNELIYTYNIPDADPQQFIGEQMVDTILTEVYRRITDSYEDKAGFRWIRTWHPEHQKGVLPDLNITPPDLSFRLFIKGIAEGE